VEHCVPEDNGRNTAIRTMFTYKNLAYLRNYILSKIKTDYLFSIDSDILLINPETINLLIADNKDIVSSLIYNGYIHKDGKFPHHYTNAMIKCELGYKHLAKMNIGNLLQNVDVTGAIYLISKNVLKNKNIRYGIHNQGEDIPFCESAKKNGIDLYVDLGVYNQHIMNEDCLKLFIEGKLF
jgi:predicted peroxiredoxin